MLRARRVRIPMMLAVALGLAVSLATPRGLAAQPSWNFIPDLPHPHIAGAITVARDAAGTERIYIMGGYDPSALSYDFNDWLDSYDPSHGWRSPARMLSTRAGHAAAAAPNGMIYLIGGTHLYGDPGYVNTLERYDPVADVWSTMFDATTPLAPVPVTLSGARAVAGTDPAAQACIFVFGGYTAPGGLRNLDVLKYVVATNTWVTLSDARGVAGSAAAEASMGCDGRIHLVAGSDHDLYDPANDSWELGMAPPLDTPTSAFGFTNGPDGILYAVNGWTPCSIGGPAGLGIVQGYDPVALTWSSLPPTPEHGPGDLGAWRVLAATLGDGVYAFGDAQVHGSCGVTAQYRALRYGPIGGCTVCDAGHCRESCASRWVGTDGASWSAGANWDPPGEPNADRALLENGAPGDNQCVLSPAGGSVCGATVRGSAAGQQQLVLEGSLSAAGGTIVESFGSLLLAGGSVTGGVDVQAGGELRGWGSALDVANQGLVQAEGASLVLSGAFQNQSGGMLRVTPSSQASIPAAALVQDGSIEVQTGALASFGGQLTNSAGGVVDVGGGQLQTGTSMVNDGTLYLGLAPGSSLISAPGGVVNNGIATTRPGNNSIVGEFDNDGTLTLGTGSVNTIAGGGVNSGLINKQLGSVTIVTPGFTSTGGTVLGPGFCIGCRMAGGAPAEFTVAGDFQVDAPSTIKLGATNFTLVGDFDVAVDDPARFDFQDTHVQLVGISAFGTQDLEVMGRDEGTAVALSDPDLFTIGTLQLGPVEAEVKLVNAHANGWGEVAQAAYVAQLVLEDGVSLDLAGQTLYYAGISPADFADPSHNIDIHDSVGGGMLLELYPTGVPTTQPAGLGRPIVLRSIGPNPFASGTDIRFALRMGGDLAVRIYDVRGSRVATLVEGFTRAGEHSVRWDGLDSHGDRVRGGIYFYRMETAGARATGKLTVLR